MIFKVEELRVGLIKLKTIEEGARLVSTGGPRYCEWSPGRPGLIFNIFPYFGTIKQKK